MDRDLASREKETKWTNKAGEFVARGLMSDLNDIDAFLAAPTSAMISFRWGLSGWLNSPFFVLSSFILSFHRDLLQIPVLSICGVLLGFVDRVEGYAGCRYWFWGAFWVYERICDFVLLSILFLPHVPEVCRPRQSSPLGRYGRPVISDITRSNSSIIGCVPSLTDTVISLIEYLNQHRYRLLPAVSRDWLGRPDTGFTSRDMAKLIDPLWTWNG